MGKFLRMDVGICTTVVIGLLVLIQNAVPRFFNNTVTFSGDMKLQTNHQYSSPHISTVKGLRLEITNLSGRELLASRQIWSADYGYFIRVIPSTAEVTILGNPVYDQNSRDIYWSYSGNDPNQNKKFIKIDMHLYPLQGNEEITNSSLYMNWYNNEIVYVNNSIKSN